VIKMHALANIVSQIIALASVHQYSPSHPHTSLQATPTHSTSPQVIARGQLQMLMCMWCYMAGMGRVGRCGWRVGRGHCLQGTWTHLRFASHGLCPHWNRSLWGTIIPQWGLGGSWRRCVYVCVCVCKCVCVSYTT